MEIVLVLTTKGTVVESLVHICVCLLCVLAA